MTIQRISEEDLTQFKRNMERQANTGGEAVTPLIRPTDSKRRKPCTCGPQAGWNPAASPPPVASSMFHYSFAITGQLPSGKNQVQMLWRRGKIQRVPNKTFTNWRAAAGLEILEQPRPVLPLSTPIRLQVDYWPGNRIVRDVSGQLDALFSLLVHVHILNNDGLVYDVTWRRHEVNRKFPKVAMELSLWR